MKELINNITLGDCLQLMPRIEDESVDMILCDLPYNTTSNKWDKSLPFDELWSQYTRIIKPTGAIVLFAQMPFSAKVVASNYKLFRYNWVWAKESRPTGFLNAKFAPLKLTEDILVFSKAGSASSANPPMNYYPVMRVGKPYIAKSSTISTNYGKQKGNHYTVSNGERYPINLLNFARDKDKLHPTQKPVQLLRYLIRTYTKADNLVLDNCAGSGSTCVACVKEGRNFIGIELMPEYHKIACERVRVAQAEKQATLF